MSVTIIWTINNNGCCVPSWPVGRTIEGGGDIVNRNTWGQTKWPPLTFLRQFNGWLFLASGTGSCHWEYARIEAEGRRLGDTGVWFSSPLSNDGTLCRWPAEARTKVQWSRCSVSAVQGRSPVYSCCYVMVAVVRWEDSPETVSKLWGRDETERGTSAGWPLPQLTCPHIQINDRWRYKHEGWGWTKQ